MENTTTTLSKSARQTTSIKFPLYNCLLKVIVTNDIKTEEKRICKKYKLIHVDDGSECEGVLFSPVFTDYILVIDEKYLTHNTIAHEVFHATRKITEDRDIRDEEQQAWVSGHIAGEIYKFLDKKKFTIKHG